MIQYRHRNVAREEIPATFAYDLPPPEAFTNMILSADAEIDFQFGTAILRRSDHYTKSIGRTQALRDLKVNGLKKFFLQSVTVDNGRVSFHLTTDHRDYTIYIEVTHDVTEGWARLEHVDIA